MMRGFRAIRGYGRSEAGSMLPVAALLLPLILGMAGASVDISSWMMMRHKMQAAADAAAMAGAWELANGGTTSMAQDAALREAQNNGYDPNIGTLQTTVTTTAGGARNVTTNITEKVSVWFASVFINRDVYTATTATAQEVSGGGYCVLALDPTASGAISAGGSVGINAPNCGLAANSTSNTALSVGGSSTVHVGAIKLSGGYSATAGLTYTSMRTNAAATRDPYTDLTVPSTSCTSNQMKSPATYNSNATLNPGTYCGGIKVTGQTKLTLNPGTYILDGGDFSMPSGGLTGTGVTIILTNSGGSSYGTWGNLNISGNSPIALTAPTSGTYKGVVVYQDRRSAASSQGNKLTGTSSFDVEGVVYTPSRGLDFGGNNQVSGCTQLVAKTVSFQGNPVMSNSCADMGTRNIGNPGAKLVL